jgi:hypothetical protein
MLSSPASASATGCSISTRKAAARARCSRRSCDRSPTVIGWR